MTASSGAILSLIGGGFDALGSIYSGYLNKGVMSAYSGVSEAQAQLERANQGLIEFGQRKDLRSFTGRQVAGYAGAGVEFTGSPLSVMFDTMATGELSILTGRINSDLAAKNYEIQAQYQKRMGRVAVAQGFAEGLSTMANKIGTSTLLSSGSTSTGKTSLTKGGAWNDFNPKFKIGQ